MMEIRKTIMTAGLCLAAILGSRSSDAGTVVHHSLNSSLLGREYRYTVYLPDGYGTSEKSYPVFYLLHGANGDETDWQTKGKVDATLDRLIGDGTIQPVVVVMPGHKRMWWVDGNGEPAESVFLGELMPDAEQRLRVIRERSGRGIGGLSAGGYGAVRMVFEHPELFAAAAALSPAVYTPLPPGNSSAVKDPPFLKNGTFDGETWTRLNWPTLIDAYKAQPVKVPLYINSGDHDKFGIAVQASSFYAEMLGHQPSMVEFRVVDGDHEWGVWERTVGDALIYCLGHMSRPIAPSPPQG